MSGRDISVLLDATGLSEVARRHCKDEVKRGLKGLRPLKRPSDAMTQLWLAAKCDACGACPKMLARLGVTGPAPPPWPDEP